MNRHWFGVLLLVTGLTLLGAVHTLTTLSGVVGAQSQQPPEDVVRDFYTRLLPQRWGDDPARCGQHLPADVALEPLSLTDDEAVFRVSGLVTGADVSPLATVYLQMVDGGWQITTINCIG